MNKIKVVFFDMGNTLLHFHKVKSDDEKDIDGLFDYFEEIRNKHGVINIEKECGLFISTK